MIVPSPRHHLIYEEDKDKDGSTDDAGVRRDLLMPQGMGGFPISVDEGLEVLVEGVGGVREDVDEGDGEEESP